MLLFYTNKKYTAKAFEIFIMWFETATQGTELISF